MPLHNLTLHQASGGNVMPSCRYPPPCIANSISDDIVRMRKYADEANILNELFEITW